MARGESGRIVLEIDPEQKEQLYAAVTKEGMTLKDWFLRKASEYLQERSQPSLFGGAVISETSSAYKVAGQAPKAKTHPKRPTRKKSTPA